MRNSSAPSIASMAAIVLLAMSVSSVSATYTYIAGYEPRSTVTTHANIDLDVKDIITLLKTAPNNGGLYADCSTITNACNWNTSTTPYPTLWDTTCTHNLVIPTTGVTIGTETIAFTAHGLSDGDKVTYNNGGGAAIAGLTHKATYFVVNKATDTFKVSATSGGTAKDLTGTGNDAQYFTPKHNFDFGVVGADFRKEVVQKGMIYLNIFPYVIWEMQDAINDCKDGQLTSNDSPVGGNSVHAWDEAVAFYAGSLEGVEKGGLPGNSGTYLQYYLADKRCANFGTCTAKYVSTDSTDDFSGESKLNEEIIKLFMRGEDEISAAVDLTTATKCDIAAKTMEEIATKMLVPFIQGTIRYLHKTSTTSGRSAKQAGELFAFASTILPFIHAVDPAAATMLYDHVWNMPVSPDDDLNSVATIKSAMEATYPKLGFGAGIGTIKCSDIGQLYPYLSGCVDTISSTIADYAGYEPLTDVSMHSRIDLDLEAIASSSNIGGTCGSSCKLSDCSVTTSVMADGTGCNYDGTTLAWPTTADGSVDIWTNGEHSNKASSMRTIRGFASNAKDKASGNTISTNDVAYKDNKFVAIMNKYWKSKNLDEHTWGEQMIKAAFEGTKVGTNTHLDFSTVGRDFRQEAIQKGIVYANIFPYVIWEMQDAVNDCLALAGTNNDDKSVHAWDEAVAFYAGSKTRGIGYGASGGNLQYALADKRCKNFKTCADGFTGVSKVNQDIFALFELGKEEARKSAISASTADCVQLNILKEKIATLSLVPFVQGTLRYLYKTRNDDSKRNPKQVGELWAFATAILPFVHEVDANAAEMLYRRAWQLDFTTDSYEAIKTALEATYPKLGAGAGVGLVTCEAVGDLYSGTTDDTLSSAGTCYPRQSKEDDDEALALGLGLGLGLVAAAGLTAAIVFAAKERKTRLLYKNLMETKLPA